MRIELEQQNAAQAELIRAQASLLACSKQHILQASQKMSRSAQDSILKVTNSQQQLHCSQQLEEGCISNVHNFDYANHHLRLHTSAASPTGSPEKFGAGLSPTLPSLSAGSTSTGAEPYFTDSRIMEFTQQGLEQAFTIPRGRQGKCR